MIADPTPTPPATAARLSSLAELWQYIDDAAPAPKNTSTARTGLAKVKMGVKFGKRTYAVAIDNEHAYRILKRGISSKAIGPLAAFLGLGKGNVAEYLDMDRVTANRRAQKNRHCALRGCRFGVPARPRCGVRGYRACQTRPKSGRRNPDRQFSFRVRAPPERRWPGLA